MGKRLTIEHVREFIEGKNYQLLSTEYINTGSKLILKCDKDHTFEMGFSNFQRGNRCPICWINSQKHTLEYIKKYIEKEGHQLISDNYKNAHEKLEIKCDKGHVYNSPFNHFQQGCRCPICKGLNNGNRCRYSYKYIKEFVEKEEYQLISTKYDNVKTKLELKCDKGHYFKVTFNNFQQGKRCPICDISQKLTFNYVQEFIKNIKGYQLISTKYDNVKTKLELKCDKGHYFNMCFNKIQQGQRCPICDLSNKTSRAEKEILEYIKSIYSGEVIGNDRNTILNFITGKYLELDVYLKELKLAFEFNGNYFHNDDIFPGILERDKRKLVLCRELGISLCVVWEDDFMADKEKCFKIIRDLITKHEKLMVKPCYI